MSKLMDEIVVAVIDHQTKGSLGDSIAAIEDGTVLKGKVRRTLSALKEREARPVSNKGLKNGTYTVPAFVADSVGFAEIGVKWTYNRRHRATMPYVFIDGEYTPASNPNRRRAVTLVTNGIAVPGEATEVAEDNIAL